MTNRYIYITLLAVLGFSAETTAGETGRSKAPRLVISVTIDQLRSDYLEAFAPLYSENGFKRLMNEGRTYSSGTYPFAPLDRASAIAALASGITPYYNNIIGRQWMNRETLRPTCSIEDERYEGLLTAERVSPAALSTSTIGDELKVATDGEAIIYALAPVSDAAILSAGHAADGAFWIDDESGEWCSSQYYFKKLPTWVRTFNKDFAPSHKTQGTPSFKVYKESRYVNADVTTMAQQCIVSTGMGKDEVTDLLCVTYLAGRTTMTDSQSGIQDAYVRLDHELERLILSAEQWFAKENVLFLVTSTGYFDDEELDYEKYRIPSGTFYMNRTAGLLNMYFGAIWGQEKYVEATYRNHIFLNHKLLDAKKISISEASSRAQELLVMMSGVRHVYTSLQLLTSQDEYLRKIRNGYSQERCGDLVIETAPGWSILNEETGESEPSRSSIIQFPIFFYGANTPAERVNTPTSVECITATIAHSIRIRAPNACQAEPLF